MEKFIIAAGCALRISDCKQNLHARSIAVDSQIVDSQIVDLQALDLQVFDSQVASQCQDVSSHDGVGDGDIVCVGDGDCDRDGVGDGDIVCVGDGVGNGDIVCVGDGDCDRDGVGDGDIDGVGVGDGVSTSSDLQLQPMRPVDTVVLLHGYLESLDVWEDFTPLLTPAMRVISLDLPGHGVSQVMGEVHTMEFLADVVCGVLDSLNVEKCTVVGHSMGGYVALAFLKKYPHKLSGLVMLHSTANADTEHKREMREREIGVITSGKRDLLAATAPINGFAVDNRRRFSNDIYGLSERIQMFDEDGITALLRGLASREDMNGVLSGSGVAKLFIFGCKDEYIQQETADQMVHNNPDASVVWLANSGHMGFIEEPQAVADAIIEFVKRC